MQVRGWLLALLVGVAALWGALALTGRMPSAGALPADTGTGAVAVPPALGDIEAAADRLRRRLDAGAARLDPPLRNPFRFGGAAPPTGRGDDLRAPAASVPRMVEAVPLEPAAPRLTLVGLAERTIEGQPVRTAVLSLDGDLHYVEAGDRVQGRFEVIAVGVDTVELRDLADGSLRLLK